MSANPSLVTSRRKRRSVSAPPVDPKKVRTSDPNAARNARISKIKELLRNLASNLLQREMSVSEISPRGGADFSWVVLGEAVDKLPSVPDEEEEDEEDVSDTRRGYMFKVFKSWLSGSDEVLEQMIAAGLDDMEYFPPVTAPPTAEADDRLGDDVYDDDEQLDPNLRIRQNTPAVIPTSSSRGKATTVSESRSMSTTGRTIQYVSRCDKRKERIMKIERMLREHLELTKQEEEESDEEYAEMLLRLSAEQNRRKLAEQEVTSVKLSLDAEKDVSGRYLKALRETHEACDTVSRDFETMKDVEPAKRTGLPKLSRRGTNICIRILCCVTRNLEPNSIDTSNQEVNRLTSLLEAKSKEHQETRASLQLEQEVHSATKVNLDLQQRRTESIESALHDAQERHVALTVALDREREARKEEEEAHQRTLAIIEDFAKLTDDFSDKSSVLIRRLRSVDISVPHSSTSSSTNSFPSE
ncbi:hypothetical protein K440DRAFT_670384 [Wilcoxina mikolae CBS 423.85]|nr:hypothetical protein K440DRAFT_670384 [Wilcoxina mikolae CBS 423.85]